MSSTRARASDESGVVIILWAIMMVALMTMVAIVLDLGALRADRRANRSAADAGATAGAFGLGEGDPLTACADAWLSVTTNIGQVGAPSPCSSTFTSACDPAAPLEVVQPLGDYIISIKIPVADSDPFYMKADSIGGNRDQAYYAATDGIAPCERIGVRIQLARTAFFAQVIGMDASSTDSHSVARYTDIPGGIVEFPALVALEETQRCAIDSGNGTIKAFATVPVPGWPAMPGIIHADSTGDPSPADERSCSVGSITASRVFFSNSNDVLKGVIAEGTASQNGELGHVAPTSPDRAFNNGNFVGDKRLLPEPTTRAPVDDIYHCGNLAVDPCASPDDHIAGLHTRLADGTPAGFSVFPTPPAAPLPPRTAAEQAVACANIPVGVPTFAAGDWFIDCPAGFDLSGRVVTFGGGQIVFAGDVIFGSGSEMLINPLGADIDSTVVVRGTSGISTDSNTWAIEWNRTFLYMGNNSCGGTSSIDSQCGKFQVKNGTVAWNAPTGGDFEDLLYWTETTQAHEFSGTPTFLWEGIYFAGNSPFVLVGNITVDARDVQLWVNSVNVQNSSARLLLRPDPERAISLPRSGTQLIR